MLPPSTKAEIGFNRVAKWLDDCLATHTKCTTVENRALPTRVLAIGETESDPIPLLETQGVHGTYICLSLCWGKVLPIRTTRLNIESHKSGILWDQLPLHFKMPSKSADASG